jgi:hypothetical protein
MLSQVIDVTWLSTMDESLTSTYSETLELMQEDQMCTYGTGQGYGHEWRKDE